jgi:hypothetical protein
MSAPEGFIPVNGSAGNSAPVGGRRRKLKLVTKKQARRSLKKLGLKMRGGAPTDPVVADAATGAPVAELKAGRRRHGGKKTRKHRSASRRVASMFGL